jgi:hypothetical protein
MPARPALRRVPIMREKTSDGLSRRGLLSSRFAFQRRGAHGAADRAAVRRRAHYAADSRLLSRRAFPLRVDSRIGRTRLPRRQLGRLQLRRHEQRRIRPCHAGAGARRFRHSQLRLRAGRVGHVPDLHLRQRGAEEPLAAASPKRICHRMFWPDRARLRLEPGRHAHHGHSRRGRLGAQWREDLDHQWRRGRGERGVGAHAGGHRRFPGGARHARLLDELDIHGKLVDARVGDVESLDGGLPCRRGRAPARCQRG